MQTRQILDRLARECAALGFDLIAPLQVGTYNLMVEGPLRLDDFGSGSHLALVVANSRALWPRFVQAFASDAALRAEPDPLDRYTERSLEHVLGGLDVTASVRFAHEGGARRVAMQRLASAARLAYLSESHLSIHPQFGPWIGLRAAVSFPLVHSHPAAPELEHPCGTCQGHCLPAFERALAAADGELTERAARESWRSWVACRDACPTGRAYRYSEAQIRYHYLKERQQLEDECRRASRID
jgi:hypothetical protein